MSGGGKGSKSAKAPDYTALAQQQGQINKETARELTAANRPNQYDAFGNSITWSQTPSAEAAAAKQQLDYWNNFVNGGAITDGRKRTNADIEWAKSHQLKDAQAAYDKVAGTGTWTQTQNLSPEIKAIWDKYISDAGSAMGSYGDLLNNYLGNYQSPEEFSYGDVKGYNDAEFNGDSVANALYGSVMDRGRVEQRRESDALNTQLRQQGLVPGSEAYNRAMQNLMTSQNDANLLAAQNATLAGGAEGRAKYASYLSGQGQGYEQALGSYTTNRNQPLQELAGMAGIAGGQPYSPTYPSFGSATGYQPADVVGAAQAQYGAKQNSANASNSKSAGLLGAGASLGGSFLGGK